MEMAIEATPAELLAPPPSSFCVGRVGGADTVALSAGCDCAEGGGGGGGGGGGAAPLFAAGGGGGGGGGEACGSVR